MTPNVRLPALELLDTMHSFPGPFVFKVIGDAHDDFVGDALTLAMSPLHHSREVNYTSRTTSGGRHTAVTLTIQIESAPEVHLVYEKLLTITGLKLLF
jgi:uncharacterized protein